MDLTLPKAVQIIKRKITENSRPGVIGELELVQIMDIIMKIFGLEIRNLSKYL